MIHANRIVTVGEQECIIDRPIVLYRGDREVEIEFTLVGNEFTFSEEGNVIKSVNASHGQLVLNTPSGEHMFSELAECHEGKVVFVVTKEMIDEFVEMGFYSFQIRLYDSAEMKSRVTIPPVMNGFDIRNPIAAEDETNVVDQGIVDYARIFKDQSNEELPTFTWDGEYVKTEWVHHDVITENKLNKIEDALYSINANIKESDVVMLNTLDQVKKDADAYVKEHMAEVEADVDEFERNLNTGVEQFKIDTNAAMTAHKNEVSEELESVNSQLAHIEMDKDGYVSVKSFVCDDGEYVKGDGLHDDTSGFKRAINSGYPIKIPVSDYKITSKLPLLPNLKIKGEGNNSNLILFLQEGEYCFENTEDNLTRVVIDNIGFTVTSGNQKVGAIKYEKSLRGFKLSNIWCSNMSMCIYSGSGTFGATVIENIFTTYFPVTPKYDDIPNIHIKGNTVFMRNIEILGSYKYGIKFENTEVCSLRDFNIAGSEDNKMEYAIYCYKSKSLTIDRGWIEQLKVNNYGTGKEYGIYWKESEGVIDGVLLAHGSVYVDNSRSVLLRKNNFYSEGAGLIRLNGSDVKTDFNSIGAGGTFIKELQDGNIIFTDVDSNTHNIMCNPTLKYPCDVSFITKTNTNIIIEDNLSYVKGQSADRTLKITIPSTMNGEGVYFNLNSLDYQELYTFITNIKCLSNVKNVYLELPSSAKLRNQSPSCLINTNSQKLDTFYPLKVGFQSDNAKNNIGLIIEKENPSLEASILIDSCMCYRGYSSNNHVMNYNNTKMFSKNTPTGKWVVGDIVYNIDPGNSTNNFVGWVCNYVEGNTSYWKKFGQVIS